MKTDYLEVHFERQGKKWGCFSNKSNVLPGEVKIKRAKPAFYTLCFDSGFTSQTLMAISLFMNDLGAQ